MGCKPTFERTSITSGSLSQIICSCGWESATYFGREDFACEEWKRHAKRPSARMTTIGMQNLPTAPLPSGNCRQSETTGKAEDPDR